METFVKKGNKLIRIGEGKLFKKGELMIKEDSAGVDANIGTANGIQQAQMKAKQLMNKNPGVNYASADAGKLDGQSDSTSGEGVKLEVPVNATGKQLAQAQRMTKDQGADDTQITFTKADPNNGDSTNESRIVEMRKNSIPFSKKELTNFLKSI
jgi:hypothetical protein